MLTEEEECVLFCFDLFFFAVKSNVMQHNSKRI